MKKLSYSVLIYIVLTLILSITGYMGAGEKEVLEFALESFNNIDIQTGRLFFQYAIIPVTIYKITIILFILFVVQKSCYNRFASWIDKKIKYRIIKLALSFILIFFVLSIFRLPFNIFIGYYRSHLFQLSEINFSTWLLRYLGASSISIVMYSVSFTLLSLLIIKVKRYLLYLPLAFFILSISISVIYPRFITPLFYETERITDNELKGKIDRLAESAGIIIDDIRILKKGKYHSSVNAYLVGFGSQRKIYLYDTLTEKFGHDEILSVLAHEIIHYKEEHMLIGILLGSIGIVAGIFILGKMSLFLLEFDIKKLLDVKGHPAFIILLTFLLFMAKPVENYLSRQIERRADMKSFPFVSNSAAILKMEIQIAKTNKSDVLAHPLYKWFYYTHPGTLERIRSIKKYIKSKD